MSDQDGTLPQYRAALLGTVLLLAACNSHGPGSVKGTPSPAPYVKDGQAVISCYHAKGEKPHGTFTIYAGNSAFEVTCK